MSPLNLHVLLWLYASPAKIEDNMQGTDPNVIADVVAELVADGLVEQSSKTDSGWCCSTKGRFYVDVICNLPLPVQRWEIPTPYTEV